MDCLHLLTPRDEQDRAGMDQGHRPGPAFVQSAPNRDEIVSSNHNSDQSWYDICSGMTYKGRLAIVAGGLGAHSFGLDFVQLC